MENVARVVLALEAHDVAEEVMHFLDRSGRARVVATADDDRQLAEAVRQTEPDAVVAQPSLMRAGSANVPALLAIDTHESVGSLRAALDAGARGFFLWPSERARLVNAAAASRATPLPDGRRATVVAVHGARGGVGTTFVATHLAAAASRRGSDVILIDADPAYCDVATALGAPTDDIHTIADLLPMTDELSAAHVADALWSRDGFRVLLAPNQSQMEMAGERDLAAVVRVASSCCDAVVLHLPRALDEPARSAMEEADRVLEVLTLDVLSFRATTRALEGVMSGLGARVGFVVNRVARREITPSDVVRVFGTEPLVVLPRDRAIERAQDNGRQLRFPVEQ
jgi:pilus assembly protein CpaE